MNRLDPAAHTGSSWRAHALFDDFALEDVWRLPMSGGPEDFDACVDLVSQLDRVTTGPVLVRALFAARRVAEPFPRADATTRAAARNDLLRGRLPEDLRATSVPSLLGGRSFPGVAVTPLYKTGREWAVAIASGPVDGILHVGWIADGWEHRGQLAVLVDRGADLDAATCSSSRRPVIWWSTPY